LNRIGIEAARTGGVNPTRDWRNLVIISLALVALGAKIAIAYNTIGTNDAVNFYEFGRALSSHSLEWTYQRSRDFNHPPLTAYFLRAIYDITQKRWCQDLGIHFPFALRLPGILADFLVILVLLRLRTAELKIPTWAIALFAISPVSLMVSGFHGNTDPVMVLLLVCAVWMCLRDQAAVAGLLFALSCQIKIVPLLLLPAFLFFWYSKERLRGFLIGGAITTCLLWSEPLLHFPVLFAKNVLGYGSYWGIWGITYCLRLTGLPDFQTVSFVGLQPSQQIIMSILKTLVVLGALIIAWRRRHATGPELVATISYTWLVFFIFAPGVCAQYLIWLAPFILLSSPRFYSALLVSSSIFLFAFYQSTARSWPWFIALSTDSRREIWAPWSLLPWITIIVGAALVFYQQINRRTFDLQLPRFVKLGVESP